MFMNNDILVCPSCRGGLDREKDAAVCRSCGMSFPVYAGVADFRGVSKEFSPSAREIDVRDALLAAYDSSSFEELLKIRFGGSGECPRDLIEFNLAFELSYESKGAYRCFQRNKLLADSGRSLAGSRLFLDVGCGTGTAVPWIMKGFDAGVGLDYSLVDLIVGRKFLEERGIENITLVCADARCLPFADGLFDFVNATDVIEHIVPGQKDFLREIRRVLVSGGGFYFNSPNRYNIFTPEPHVLVRFVGFMPRSRMDGYVMMMKGVKYGAIRLLSMLELKRVTGDVFGKGFLLTGPFIDMSAPATDFKRRIVKKMPFLLAFVNAFMKPVTTNYQVLAFKP